MSALRVIAGLTSVALIALLHPSAQYSVVVPRRTDGPADPPHAGVEATSVPAKPIVGPSAAPSQANSPHSLPRRQPRAHTSSSPYEAATRPTEGERKAAADTGKISRLHTTRPASPRKTNSGGRNFRTSHRLSEAPTKSSRGADAEGVLRSEEGGESKTQKEETVTVGRGTRQKGEGSVERPDQNPRSPIDPYLPDGVSDRPPQELDSGIVEIAKPFHIRWHGESSVDGGEGEPHRPVLSGGGNQKAVLAEEEAGERQFLQQPVPHSATDPHVAKMVLTVFGSVAAVLGVCVMAAIFQCCCRRKGSSSPDGRGEQEEKENLDQKSRSTSRSSRSSKSPSPHKVLPKDEDEEVDKGQSEQDALLDGDKDLGDFSAVQRETSILRSYRKPPPPKNRARASRVPRALKAVDPKASPSIFQELVDQEQKDDDTTDNRQKTTNGKTSTETVSPDMQSSMLADIDNTLAAMHTTKDTSPSRSADRSRESSVEKQTVAKTSKETVAKTSKETVAKTSKEMVAKASKEDSELAAPAKPSLSASPSKEQFAKALAQELSRSVSQEMLSKPQSKTTQKSSKEMTPKSRSAGASPKTEHSKNSRPSPSKDSMSSSNGDGSGASKSGSSAGEGNQNNSGNIFALIDPTAKDKGTEAAGKSKIPVRAASSPTQPTAPLRLSTGKRFPVPSVHGDQMDQLMKSLKTRLKEDEDTSPKEISSTASPKVESLPDDDLDPQSRDRSHSDPTKQQEERGTTLQQTHL